MEVSKQKEQFSAVFIGSKHLGLKVFKTIHGASENINWTVIHPDDEYDDRSALHDWKSFTRDHRVKLHVLNSKSKTVELIEELSPEIAFVCGWYLIIDPNVIAKIPRGIWGIHNSLLPKYRGGSPLVWSIINGDDFVGSSIFKLSSGVDDGDIVAQFRVKNEPIDTISSLLAKIEVELLELLPGIWRSLCKGTANTFTQDHSNATFCGQRREIDGRIEWTKDARDVHNFIRAQSPPYPCAHTFYRGECIKILDSEIEPFSYSGTPGQILLRTENRIVVGCGNNTAISIRELIVKNQLYSAPDYLDSLSIRLDEH